MILYLTYWIPATDRARTGALFMMAAPVAVIVGAPLSEALQKLDGLVGLKGWQWLFLIEGLPAVVLGVLSLRVLTDRPEAATWLSPQDRDWLARTMADEQARRQAVGQTLLRRSFAGGSLWLSTITSIPFVAALAAMFVVGRHSDRTGERRLHVAAGAVTSAAGLVLAIASQGTLWLLVASFTISQMAHRALFGVFWAMPPQLLGGTAAAAGIALINSIGNLGGFVGLALIGALYDVTGSYTGGLLALMSALVIEAGLVLALKLPAPDKPSAR